MFHLRADLTIKYGQIGRFSELFVPVKERLESKGWKLIGAYQAIIGDFTKVLHIWKIEDANMVPQALFAAMAEADFAPLFAELGDLIEAEQTQIVLPTPYSPNYGQ